VYRDVVRLQDAGAPWCHPVETRRTFEVTMTTAPLVRFFHRAILSIGAMIVLAAPTRGEDVDVFELLTGRSAPPPASAPEPSVAMPLPAETLSPVTIGVHVEPAATDLFPLYTLVAEVEEVQPGAEQPLTPLTEMSLNRPIDTLTISPAPPRQLQERMRDFEEQYQIRNLALDQFGSWADPRYDATWLISGYAPSCFAWAAPAVFNSPLYIEKPNFESNGH
jgi:hypothetical protein